MRIGVNLFPLRPQVAGGLEFYVRNLLPEMFELGGSDHFYYLITAPWNDKEIDFGRGPYRKIFIDASSGAGVIDRLRARLRRSHWDIYRCAMELNVDVWFCPMMDLNPRHIDIPSVVTVPDIQYEFYPQFFTPEELRHRELTVKPSCRLATGVITISEYSKKTLLGRHELDPGKVHSICLAAGREYSLQGAREAWPSVVQRFGLKEGYLFYPANTWPHKNHEMLLTALQRLKKRGLTPELVLTGAQIESMERMKELASQLGCESQLHHLDYVDRRFFPGLYFGAACLVFPSLFEGFGIPLVEAMACGCPVASSNVCSIPEVVGEAAVLFDPRSPDSIADALEAVLRNESLRQQLVKKGLRQATLFSWEKAARETLAVFEKVCGQRVPRPAGYIPPQDIVEGFYADGWAGPKMLIRRVELSRWRTMVLEGETSCNCSPMQIRVCANREAIAELQIATPSTFNQKIALPPASPDSPLADLQILTSGHFVPRKIGLNEDTRRLSFRVHNLMLIDAVGNTMSFHGKQ